MKNKTTLALKVEILGGQDIKDACESMCALSKQLNMAIESDFNGFRLLAYPGTKPATIKMAYNLYLGINNKGPLQ